MSTKEKLIGHVMKEQPVGCQNKVTVVGVGMVGMASAISILLKVRGSPQHGGGDDRTDTSGLIRPYPEE